MTAAIIDGKAIAEKVREEVRQAVARMKEDHGYTPGLATVLVGENPASATYVRSKRKTCEELGIRSIGHELPADATQQQVEKLVADLSANPNVNGILVQLPLPKGLEESRVLDAVNPLKDVDAFHSDNVGRIVQGRPRFLPCTPHGIQQLFLRRGIAVEGSHVVMLGRSDIVGKPMAIMLMQRTRGANATVTVCHSRTRNLAEITRQADILIVAIGQPKFVKADMVKPGAVVIDVGMNRNDEGKLCGDVDFEGVKNVAGWITPVPGGVGPMTITMLLVNTIEAAERELGVA